MYITLLSDWTALMTENLRVLEGRGLRGERPLGVKEDLRWLAIAQLLVAINV